MAGIECGFAQWVSLKAKIKLFGQIMDRLNINPIETSFYSHPFAWQIKRAAN
jgi:hypothetical protein